MKSPSSSLVSTPEQNFNLFSLQTLSLSQKNLFIFSFTMPRSKSLFSDSDAEVLVAQEKYLAAKAAVQERKKREREEAEQKQAEEERKEKKAAEVAAAAAAEKERKKKKAVEAEKAKKASGLKAAEKWKAVEESDSDDIKMVDEAPPK